MKISTKTRYGMRFMIELAKRWGDGCVSMKDIADGQGISKKYLEQVVAPFSEAGLLRITRGNRGGYELSRSPKEITLADVVDASEGGLELTDCLGEFQECTRVDECLSRAIWSGMQDVIVSYLKSKTLFDIVNTIDKCENNS